jgi:DNA repair protein RecO (recombination protein O)
MILKTQAIALRIAPFAETSRIVTWLTADHGRLATIIKGSQRRKSQFLGQYDLFYTCELLFYLRRYQGVHIVKECTPLKPRDALRSRWRAAACASYFAWLAARISPPYAPHPELFRLLDKALDAFSAEPNLSACLNWFELKIMAVLGVAPQLQTCLKCRRSLNANPDPAVAGGLTGAAGRPRPVPFFSYARGGVVCAGCAAALGPPAEKIAPDILAILRCWQQSRAWSSARNVCCTARQLRELERILGLFLQYHLEVSPVSRNLALEIVRHRFRQTEASL